MASVLVPVLYVIIVFGSLFVFSSFYRRQTASRIPEPYFPQHRERDLYVSLLQKTDPPAPEPLLKAALVRRAMTDVTRILRLREDKPALQNLLQKGSIGDDLWNSLQAAEKELEAEILEVVAEANAYVEGWGQIIFQTATEMTHNERMRVLLEQSPAARAEKERKYSRKTNIRPTIEAPAHTKEAVAAAPSAPPAPTSPPPPETPLSPKSANGLSPPPSASVESGVSDNEGSVTSPTSPRTPSKSPKKSKKRK